MDEVSRVEPRDFHTEINTQGLLFSHEPWDSTFLGTEWQSAYKREQPTRGPHLGLGVKFLSREGIWELDSYSADLGLQL